MAEKKKVNCSYTDLVDVHKVVPNPKNNNKHDKKQIERLAKIIDFQGQRRPLIVSKTSGFLNCGHCTLESIKLLGWDKVAVDYQEFESEAAEYANMTADNELARWAEFDKHLLITELEGGLDLDLDLLGIENLELPNTELCEDKEDDVPELKHEPITKLGDVWLLGSHRVMCGDSTMIDDVEKLMDGTYPDLIHTDPPYGMSAVSKSGVLSKNYAGDIMGDENQDVAKDAFSLINGLYPSAKQIWWGANYYCSVLPDSEYWLVWDKNNGQSDQTDCELAWANFRSVVRQFTQASEKTNRVHPTQKPVSLTEWILKRFKLSSKTVADYFGGSGSTLIAAEKHGKQCYMMEFDPKLTDIIVKRWQEYTKKEATLESSGETYDSLAVDNG